MTVQRAWVSACQRAWVSRIEGVSALYPIRDQKRGPQLGAGTAKNRKRLKPPTGVDAPALLWDNWPI